MAPHADDDVFGKHKWVGAHLVERRCIPCGDAGPPLEAERARKLLSQLPNWTMDDEEREIRRTVEFGTFLEAMAFVNAVAWQAHSEGHHPDIEIYYTRCTIRFRTHAVGALTENDFICAAQVDGLLK